MGGSCFFKALKETQGRSSGVPRSSGSLQVHVLGVEGAGPGPRGEHSFILPGVLCSISRLEIGCAGSLSSENGTLMYLES